MTDRDNTLIGAEERDLLDQFLLGQITREELSQKLVELEDDNEQLRCEYETGIG